MEFAVIIPYEAGDTGDSDSVGYARRMWREAAAGRDLVSDIDDGDLRVRRLPEGTELLNDAGDPVLTLGAESGLWAWRVSGAVHARV